MPANKLLRWLESLYGDLDQSAQRQILSLQGSRSWCDAQLASLIRHQPGATLISNRHRRPGTIAYAKAATCLGGESRLVLLDLFDGMDADVLCIAAGMVRAGGLLVLLSPTPAEWNPARDRYACWQDGRHSRRALFVEYFFDALEQDAEIGIVIRPRFLPFHLAPLPRLERTSLADGATAGQAAILAKLQDWPRPDRRGIALISAARGRGKSTCLGMLAAVLQDKCTLLVSARSRSAAARLLERAPGARFVAPDRLLRERPQARLLIVDEAAAIPLPMLRGLCRCYPMLIMATTSAGYEGTGQGFMLRFAATIEDREVLRFHLDEPLRWCRGDRLETWLDRCLMMPSESMGTNRRSDIETNPVSGCRLRLVEDPGSVAETRLLRESYRLLCSAHYRTRPSDLRMLMENPDLALIVAELRGRVIGVALLNREGGFEKDLSEAVFFGHRRPRGHLLAQMLTAQAGCRRFATYRGLRVQRIAVDPACRRQGIGTRLVGRALRLCRERGLDYLGASFALDTPAASFWRHAGFRLVHVSFAAGKSSGHHSLAVIRPVGKTAKADIERMTRRLVQQLPAWLTQFLQQVDCDLVVALLRLARFRCGQDSLQGDEVEAFARGNRGFELSFASLQAYVMERIARGDSKAHPLLVEKAVQNRPWSMLERDAGSEGRKQLLRRLRALVAALDKA